MYGWLFILNHSILEAISLGKKNKRLRLQNEDTKTQSWCKSKPVHECEMQSDSVCVWLLGKIWYLLVSFLSACRLSHVPDEEDAVLHNSQLKLWFAMY